MHVVQYMNYASSPVKCIICILIVQNQLIYKIQKFHYAEICGMGGGGSARIKPSGIQIS